MKHCKGPKRGKKPILVQNQILEFFKMFHIFTCENKVFFFLKKISKKSKRKNYKKLQLLFLKKPLWYGGSFRKGYGIVLVTPCLQIYPSIIRIRFILQGSRIYLGQVLDPDTVDIPGIRNPYWDLKHVFINRIYSFTRQTPIPKSDINLNIHSGSGAEVSGSAASG